MTIKKNKTILLVEDEAIISLALEQTVKKFGYDVLTAKTGEDAVQLACGNESINLILMDIDLGKGMNGSTASEIILSSKNIPIIFITSHSEREIVEKVRGITRYGYVIKNSGDFVLSASIEMAFELFEAHKKSRENEEQIIIKNNDLAQANEELNAALEEMEATNEELISTNQEMMKTQQALLNSELQLRMITNNIPALISYVDADDLKYLFVNKVFAKNFGMTPEEIFGKQVKDILGEESFSRALPYINRARSGQRVEYENIIPAKNELRWFNINYLPEFDEKGKVKSIIVLIFDIHERKRIEEELKKSEEKLSRFFMLSPAAISTSTIPDGKFVEVNDSFLRILGYTREEVIGKTGADINLWVDTETRNNIYRELKDKGSFLDMENKYHCRDGSIITCLASGVIIDINGTSFLLAVTLDITERKKAEEDLHIFKDLVEYSSDAIGMSTPDGKHYYQNEAFNLLFGDIGDNPLDVYADKSIGKQLFDSIMQGKNWQGEVKMFGKDRTPLEILLRAYPLRNNNGAISGLVGLHLDITQRKKIEDALRSAEDMYRNLFLNTQIGIFRTDINTGLIIDANDSVARFIGFENRNQLLSKPFNIAERYAEPKDREILISLLKENGQFTNFETRFIRNDGSIIWMRFSGKIIPEKGWMEGVSEDITIRKNAEDELQKSETLLREMTTQFPGVVYQFYARPDGDLGFYYISDRSEEVLGLKPVLEKYLDRFVELVLPEYREGFINSILDSVKESKEWKFEGIMQKPSGDKIWFSGNSIPSQRENEIVFNGVVTDITERKRFEEELRSSEEKYRFLTDNMNDIIWTMDMNFNTTYVSPSIETVLGFTPQEQIQKNISMQITPESISKVQDAFAKEIVLEQQSRGDTRKIYTYDLDFYHKDGSIRMMEIVVSKIRDAQGVWTGFLGVSRDITERKHAEDALRNLQKLESLGVLAGGIAHDFNNLLGGVFGYIDLASSASKETEVIGYLKESLDTINRARALTNQLLTFSKGGAPIRKTEHLLPIIRETVQFALSGSNVSHIIDIDQDLWPCFIDKNQIGQVIDNIIINAQQAMPMGGTIEVTAKNIPYGNKDHSILTEDKYVKISVKDFGIGIPKEIIPYIFDPFFTTKTKGHGLGLATSYSIVNRHEGLLDIESEPSKGSTFHIYLPASKETASLITSKSPVNHKGSGTIIVMDDEEFIRNTLDKMLKTQGYTCVLMKEGKEVLDFLNIEYNAKRAIAGIILDLTIPGGLGGKEIISTLREMDTLVPIIVISGYADDPVIADPEAFGFTASIGKPFTIAELSAVLEKHLKH